MSDLKHIIQKTLLEQDNLYFTRYFFKARQAASFRVNWHHAYITDCLRKVMTGEIENLVINVSPGSSKTELAIINLMAQSLAANPWCRFLHLTGADNLASLNSSTTRDIIRSEEFQKFWPLKIADDSDSKKQWNVMVGNQKAGGVYATSLGGQVTGFRAGHMADGFWGAILIDDPIKPEDAYSKVKLEAANRKLVSTVKSRRANPKTPIIIIMQRIAAMDPTGFVKAGGLPGKWTHIKIPALLTKDYIEALPDKYKRMIKDAEEDQSGRMSYWPYKEPLADLLSAERGEGTDLNGQRVSRFVFTGQYQQEPVALGGNIIKGEHFVKYKVLPRIKYRFIYADTAQKTNEWNDFSVFEEWGVGEDNKIYLLDLLRGKWESPELRSRAIMFWSKCKEREVLKFGSLRKLKVEDKSSGTDLIQSLHLPPYNIPIEGIERDKDKITRVMDALPYIESKQVCVPEDAPFTADFITECEAFTADDTHEFDDQIDPALDAIQDLLSANNKIKTWEALAKSKGI